VTRLPCCATWDDCELIAETPLMHARLDAYPVAEGHALVIPKRHVDRLRHLTIAERTDLWDLVDDLSGHHNGDLTIAVNDGPLAGRTVPHLHVHVIPRRAGDVADPRGGVRRLLIPDAGQDPWLSKEGA